MRAFSLKFLMFSQVHFITTEVFVFPRKEEAYANSHWQSLGLNIVLSARCYLCRECLEHKHQLWEWFLYCSILPKLIPGSLTKALKKYLLINSLYSISIKGQFKAFQIYFEYRIFYHNKMNRLQLLNKVNFWWFYFKVKYIGNWTHFTKFHPGFPEIGRKTNYVSHELFIFLVLVYLE